MKHRIIILIAVTFLFADLELINTLNGRSDSIPGLTGVNTWPDINVTQDNKNIYLNTLEGYLSLFKIDTLTGTLSHMVCLKNKGRRALLSKDNKYLHSFGGDYVRVYRRDENNNGYLTLVDSLDFNLGNVVKVFLDGFDNKYYSVAYDTCIISIFKRDSSSYNLSLVDTIIGDDFTISNNCKNLYALVRNSDSINIYQKNNDGNFEFYKNIYSEHIHPVTDIYISLDGHNVYFQTSSRINIFKRNRENGDLLYLSTIENFETAIQDIKTNINGNSLYVQCSGINSTFHVIPRNPLNGDITGIGAYKINTTTWGSSFDYSRNGKYMYIVSEYDISSYLVKDSSIVDDQIKVLYPNGGENITNDSILKINWTSIGKIDFVKITYKKGGKDSTIIESTENDDHYTWPIKNFKAEQIKIKISSLDGNLWDESDSAFSISNTSILNKQKILHNQFIFEAKGNTFQFKGTIKTPVKIYNLDGSLINILEATNNYIKWDGTSKDGTVVSTGVYIAKIGMKNFKFAIIR